MRQTDKSPVERLRPLSRNDLPGFNRMVNAVCRERRYMIRVEGFSLSETRTLLEQVLTRGWPNVVAEVESALVGWCMVLAREEEGFRHAGLLGMGLLPPWRGRGLGARMLDECLQQARDFGLERVELEVYASNTPAVRLYERRGFRLEGRKRRARKLEGVYDDILVMALTLPDGPG